jgi:hypothetical protein
VVRGRNYTPKLIRMVFLFTLGYLGMVLCGGLSIIEMFKQFFQYTKEVKIKSNKLDQFFY